MKDWAELADEYRDLELRHKEYREVLLSICNTRKRKGKTNEISFADLGEMHGPTEEVYQRSHTSGPSAHSKLVSHNFLPEIPAWSDQEAGQGDRGEPEKEGGGRRGGGSAERPDEAQCSVGPNAGGGFLMLKI